MTRPELSIKLSAETFLDHYWLRQELADFCRSADLSISGSKIELTERIATFLKTGRKTKPARTGIRRTVMPATYTRQDTIGEGWSCSQNLRAFFQSELGASFHFNKLMRDYIRTGAGATLQDAINAWESDQRNPAQKPIDRQFEYNRFTRAYYAGNPGASRDQVIAAWHAHRNTPKSRR